MFQLINQPAKWMLFLLFLPTLVLAHKPSDSYLFLQGDDDSLSLQWDIALRDIEELIGLDNNRDLQITWAELKQKRSEIAAQALANLRIKRGDETCMLRLEKLQVEQHSDGRYASLWINADCQIHAATVTVDYRFLFDRDPTHRGVLLDQRNGNNEGPFILAPDNNTLELGNRSNREVFSVFYEYLREGVWHIWTGFDHILFIITLLLAAVLYFQQCCWQAVDKLRPALFDVLKIVTAFTLAHSITLSLAVFKIVSLPVLFVETAIAVSIILVALNNLKPVVTRARWSLAFVFGLLHGFGFANVLIDLSLPAESLTAALLGFNLGVEFGQLAIIFTLFPLAFILRKTIFYRIGIFKGGSIAAAALATFWVVDRLA